LCAIFGGKRKVGRILEVKILMFIVFICVYPAGGVKLPLGKFGFGEGLDGGVKMGISGGAGGVDGVCGVCGVCAGM